MQRSRLGNKNGESRLWDDYYHVDYIALKRRFYGADGSIVETPINYEELPLVAAEFSLEGIKADIVDSQRNGQHYRDFTRRAMFKLLIVGGRTQFQAELVQERLFDVVGRWGQRASRL